MIPGVGDGSVVKSTRSSWREPKCGSQTDSGSSSGYPMPSAGLPEPQACVQYTSWKEANLQKIQKENVCESPTLSSCSDGQAAYPDSLKASQNREERTVLGPILPKTCVYRWICTPLRKSASLMA